ncbi:MAG: alanine--tRNA ligase [Clostridiales bacterium]|nr:alanine--tRNA ligase [Clostridiales bacterium]
MEKLGLNEIRELFLSFYAEKKEHYRHESFSLVPPPGDKSLLIINSGMAPLKPYFAGTEVPPAKRMTTCQKCIRTGDIENVGYTARHGTFFEMLGSFSFGDYFKHESLRWGWEFITQVLKMPEDKIWATIYEDDDEAFEIWKNEIGIDPNKIVRLGKDDNFWEIGLGPCGPCSEIYFDRGEEYGCGKEDCKPGCDCDRYLEFWNHVFTQFSKEEDGSYSNLEHKNIDTGMGLERLACIMQGVDSIFDIDTIRMVLNAVVDKAGVEYMDGKAKTDVSIRLITDHIRSVTFMISDGIMPSNEGRGYVLRRLLRRAARHGKLLGIEGKFLAELSKKVIESSYTAYPELKEKEDYIYKILTIEEDKFAATIDQGTNILAEYIEELKASGSKVLSGDKVFKLYDTYGFPIELTQEILEEEGCIVDVEGFNENMQHQKEQARAARKSDDDEGWKEASAGAEEDDTVFTGYTNVAGKGIVKSIYVGKDSVTIASEGETARIVLDQTPFYAESGGQAADVGTIKGDGFEAKVVEVTKNHNVFSHKIEVVSGEIKVGDVAELEICIYNRNATARNHTATHLLHKALKEVIGDHVAQAGSSVTADGLRFDFSHFEAISAEDLKKVEQIVNEKILEFIPVVTEEKSMQDAVDAGATALFGEKYGDTVRVVSVGDFSMELCGGTHVANSGQIGSFKIVSESGVAAGVRRIEAVTGGDVLNKANESEAVIKEASEILKTNPTVLLQRIANMNEELKALKKELEEIKKADMGNVAQDMLANAEEINGVKLLMKSFEGADINDLRTISDDVKKEAKGVILVLAAINDGKVTFMVSVSDDLLEKGYHAGNMIKKIAAAAGGGGGGKADMAQAGAKDPSKVQDAFEVAKTLI